MTNPVENNASETPVNASVPATTAPAAAPASSGISISVSFSSKHFVNVLIAMVGAGAVFGIFHALSVLGSLFVAAVPFIFGGVLFATLVSSFFMLLRAQKLFRKRPSLRISFAEAYTALSIFVVMGCFATACMHAFIGDGLALSMWNEGVIAAGLAACGLGLGKGCANLWSEGSKA